MFKVNENYLKLPGSYLFSTIGKKVAAYKEANPDKSIISLGIGDVTQPLAPKIIESLHSAVDEMGKAETFHGYAPDLGYEFLRNAIAESDYKSHGCDIHADEIFVSDGAKCDSGNIQEIFSIDNKIAVCDPVYPVYVDTNVMAGRTGTYDPSTETWSDVIYMPCTAENDFVPDFETASNLVREAGGLVFIPHIYEYKKNSEPILEHILKNYKIDGIECYYTTFTEEQHKRLLNLCKERNLFVSGGSDFHGTIKPDVDIGVGYGNMQIPDEILNSWKNKIKFFK